MNKPKGYDETQVYEEFKKLPKGGYICKIIKLEETKSRGGNDMIIAYLDIADGEFKDYFMQKYSGDTREDKKWSCKYYQVVFDTTTQETSSGFKGFITSVEESNSGFVADKIWNDNFTKYFKDKLIGCVFADKHYINNYGEEKTFATPYRVCSIESIKKGNFKMPKDIIPDDVADKINIDDFVEIPNTDDLPF